MEPRQPKMTGPYVPAFSWHRGIGYFVEKMVPESPLLHVCSGPYSELGDVRVDRFVIPKSPGVVADWTTLPFKDNSFGAVFADPPWDLGQMKTCADFCKDAIRVAPIVYLMAPWLWVHKSTRRSKIWVRQFPGLKHPILIVRYERKNADQTSFEFDD